MELNPTGKISGRSPKFITRSTTAFRTLGMRDTRHVQHILSTLRVLPDKTEFSLAYTRRYVRLSKLGSIGTTSSVTAFEIVGLLSGLEEGQGICGVSLDRGLDLKHG